MLKHLEEWTPEVRGPQRFNLMRWWGRFLPLTMLALAALLSAENLKPTPRPIQKPKESTGLANQKASQQPTPVNASNLSHAPNGASPAEQEQNQSRDTSTIIIAVSAIVSAIAAALIAWFNWQLVGVTKDLHNASEAALDVNRPFLLVTGIAVEVKHALPPAVQETVLPTSIVHHFYFDIAIKNFGVSPADIVDFTSAAEMLNPPEAPDYADPIVWYENPGQLNDSIIGPTEHVPDRIKAANSFNSLEYKSLLDETKRIAVYGRIRYRGASKKIFVTCFYWWCFLTDPSVPQFSRCYTKKWNDHT